MQAQVKLGRVAGISIGLHYSWFIIALLITLVPCRALSQRHAPVERYCRVVGGDSYRGAVFCGAPHT